MIAQLRTSALVFALAALVAACAGERGREGADAGQETGAADTGAARSMGGMQGMMGSGQMMGQMEAHMRMMEGVGADSMRGMMTMHRQMVANMISQMNREMRDMNMTGDAAWTATMDSVRQDLVRLPELRGAELRNFMPAHRTRVMRLMEAHAAMMQSMPR